VSGPAVDDAVARASALVELKRYEQAAALVATRLAEDPADAAAWRMLAFCRLRLGDPAGACQAVDDALRHDPTNEWAWRLRAIGLLRLEWRQEAVGAAAEAVRLDPDGWLAHHTYVAVLSAAPGRGAEAYAAAVHATTLAPAEPDAHHLVGVIATTAYPTMGWPIAEQAYRTALRLDPQHADALLGMASVRLRRRFWGTPFTGAHDIAAALSIEPQSTSADAHIVLLAARLLRPARRLTAACFIVAMVCRLTAETLAGRPGDPDRSVGAAWLVRVGALASIVAVWTWWLPRTRRRLPPTLRGPVRAALLRDPVLNLLAGPVVIGMVAALVPLAVPALPDIVFLAALLSSAGFVLGVHVRNARR
jgi:tetratricopeptide (TPR) repeat protein